MLFERIDHYIRDKITEKVTDVDLELIFPDGELTPPPAAMNQRIPMGKFSKQEGSSAAAATDHGFPYEQIMELIVQNILKQKLCLRVGTWTSIIDFFKKADFRDRYSGQIPLEVLLVVSKLNADELYFYSRQKSVGRNLLYDMDIQGVAAAANKAVTDAADDKKIILPATEELVTKIKNFLNLDSIIDAILNCLKEVFGQDETAEPEAKRKVPVTERGGIILTKDSVRSEIENMRIYTTANVSFGNLRGVTLTDGILLCLGALVPEAKSQLRHDADLFCLSCHEVLHYMARRFAGDYNFSSPSKGTELSIVGQDPSSSTEIPVWKGLEFGRRVELLLFDGVQPTWQRSSDITGVGYDYPESAALFLKRAAICKNCPPALIPKAEHNEVVLIPRQCPSLSFAGDMRDQIDNYL